MLTHCKHLIQASHFIHPFLIANLGITRAALYAVLPDTFTRQDALLTGALAGMSPRNVSLAINAFISHGILLRTARAHYAKITPPHQLI